MKPTEDEILRLTKRMEEAKEAFESISKKITEIAKHIRKVWIEFYDEYEKIKKED